METFTFSPQQIASLQISTEELQRKMSTYAKEVVSIEMATRLIAHVDFTSLRSVDTQESIAFLLEKAKFLKETGRKVGGVCLYQPFIKQAKEVLNKTGIAVATVAGGFPYGQMDIELKCLDVAKSVALGADEVDMVINRGLALTDNWQSLFEEVSACKKACADAKLKVIIAAGELETIQRVYQTSMVCMMAGADFIKTSTGFEGVNAEYNAGMAMLLAIKDYHNKFNKIVGFKPAGGIRTAEDAQRWYRMVEDVLGEKWLTPQWFRIGASGLLDDLLKY